jgi:heme/copper-type cytochrome/quinol oxidase subunit 4
MEGQAFVAGESARAKEQAHPGPKEYILIGVVLSILTAAEVAVYFVEALAPVLFHILVVLSTIKFILVVMYYMPLKFDSRLFTGVFMLPFSIAVFMVVSLVFLFRIIPMI